MTNYLPPRDRRRKRRIITLRNVGLTVLAVLVVFAGFSLWRELNPRSEDGTALLDARKQKVEDLVVREEAPYVDPGVGEHDPREPLWTERPSPEEILGVDPYEQYRQSERVESPRTTTVADPEPALSFRGDDEPFLEQRSDRESSRIRITGSGTDLKLEKPAEPDDER